MEACYKLASFLLTVSLIFSVSVRGRNGSESFDEQSKDVAAQANLVIASVNASSFGFENKSNYDFREKNESASHASFTSDSGKTHFLGGLKNESFYEGECDCGYGSRGCRYNIYGEKICDCRSNYAQKNGICEWCNCGLYASSCIFENNKKKCSCYGNYQQDSYGQCAECYCGYNAVKCHFSLFSKVCTCKEGYIQKFSDCELNTVSGWRIATYLESALFALIIIVCTIIICCKSVTE